MGGQETFDGEVHPSETHDALSRALYAFIGLLRKDFTAVCRIRHKDRESLDEMKSVQIPIVHNNFHVLEKTHEHSSLRGASRDAGWHGERGRGDGAGQARCRRGGDVGRRADGGVS